MKFKLIIVIGIVIAIAIRTTVVKGLQCYVCEDCNEYEDFKELQICGEISVITTQRPITSTIPSTVVTNQFTTFNASITTLKPSRPVDTDDYLYEYSMESQDGTGTTTNTQKGDPNGTQTIIEGPTFPPTTTIVGPTFPPTTTIGGPTFPPTTTIVGTTLPTSLLGKETTIMAATVPTSLPAGNTGTNALPISVTTFKSVQPPLDYDYLEYEDPEMVDAKRLSKAAASDSVLKINEPVCYMFRYHVNNTIFTKRGCTNSINDNTYLTCQSLYNGQPMSGCRICSTDGCNKFADDESEEDQIYSAGVMKQLSAFAASILAVVTAIVV